MRCIQKCGWEAKMATILRSVPAYLHRRRCETTLAKKKNKILEVQHKKRTGCLLRYPGTEALMKCLLMGAFLDSGT